MDKAGGLPSGTLCCRHRHQYPVPPSDCLSAGTPLRLATYRSPRSDGCVPSGGGGSPQLPHQPSHHSTPSTPGGSSALHLQALRAFRGLRPIQPGSAPPCSPCGANLVDAAGFPSCCGLVGRSSSTEDFVTALLRSALAWRRPSAIGAAWSLPEPVSHRLVDVDLCE
jgi:hypothetical protein